jgi:hypothetical protein
MITDLQRNRFRLKILGLNTITNKQLANDFLGHFPDKKALFAETN